MEKKWFVWEKIRRIFPMQTLDFLAYMSTFSAPGRPIASGIKFEDKSIELISVEKEFLECGRQVAESVILDPKGLEGYLDEMDKKAKAYFGVAEGVLALGLAGKSKEELLQIFEKMYSAYTASHTSGLLSMVSEFREEFASNKIMELLSKKLAEKKLDISAPKAFALLSQMHSESILAEERRAQLELIEKVLHDVALKKMFEEKGVDEIQKQLPNGFPEFNRLLTGHWQKYQWIFFMYEGPALEKGYFIKQIKENMPAVDSVNEEFKQNKRILALQEKLLERLDGSENERIIFSFPRRLIETKALRKDAMYFGCFAFEKLFSEIAKRLGITLDEARYMQRQELVDALQGKFKDFAVLKERIKYSVFFAVNGKRTFLVGEDARKWYKANVKVEAVSNAKELKGTPAFSGFVKGRVKVINHPNEIFKMNKGDVLVSHATNPNLLPAMGMAAAIVTDIGGLTCHAAIVSREFRIPCIIGTRIATQVLKDDDLVSVDAEKGIVKKIG